VEIFRRYKLVIQITNSTVSINYNHSRISALVPIGHCSLLAVSRKRCVFHVDRLWTSTKGEGVRPMWTHGESQGRGQKPAFVDVINVWPHLEI